nr:hypothetical protein [Tanacetum cinerariifolium]
NIAKAEVDSIVRSSAPAIATVTTVTAVVDAVTTADRVRVAERQSVEDEPRLLETTVGRVVSLLLVAPARASNELEASVDKLFDEGASGDGQGTDIQPVIATTD